MNKIPLLQNKRILLGVTGSISCYKIIALASKLTQAGALVDVIMTEAAKRFVQPLAFRSVTGRAVFDDMWSLEEHVRHVGLGETADCFLIAPVTAHTLGKLANGLADNLLTVTALASRCPLLVAPAMDGGMYTHAATQANVATLRARGVTILGPAEGRMASGLVGSGRLLEPLELLAHLRLALAKNGRLSGKRVLVTTGPTREPIDPVRFISNRSTGKQGIALAQAALDAGAKVTLISGPVSESMPQGVKVVPVQTTQEMADATLANIQTADILLMVAAVADFRPSQLAEHKLKKTEAESWGMAIGLEQTLDILSTVKAQRDRTKRPDVVLGFAAETRDAFEYGRDKLLRKGLDFIAVNDVTAQGAGFGYSTNKVVLIGREGIVEEMPLQSKTAVAERIIHHVSEKLSS